MGLAPLILIDRARNDLELVSLDSRQVLADYAAWEVRQRAVMMWK